MKTEIVLLIDESSSMGSIRESVIEEINNFVKEQRTVDGECSMTLVKFNDRYIPIFENVDIHSVPMLTRETYQPFGNTALVGATGRLIDETGERYAAMPESERPQKVLFMVQTDGFENATSWHEWSKRYTKSKVAEMVKHQSDKYSWTFVFMGANQDSFLTGKEYGYDAGNTSNWDQTKEGTKTLYSQVADMTKRFRVSHQTKTASFFNQD